MNPIFFVVILKLFIANTLQNLIRFGDFQNIFPVIPMNPMNPMSQHINCSTYCDGIWYVTSPLQMIELQVNQTVSGKIQRTTSVDMIYDGYIQLCQDLNIVQIGKTYQYTFDVDCHLTQIQSCSVWVILNGQVINGSNHTNKYQLVYHNVGYMNITQENNTICFQSRQVPYVSMRGANLDNVTLQLYTGKIPCNVQDCKFCVLNFPNICQVCQYLFTLESSCQCQSKFYLDGSICKVCLFPCETCQGQGRNCLSCSNLYHLQGNQCVIADEWTLAASIIASMPGIQFFSIGQIFLGISDQFWPYYSHYRAYGNQTIEILTFFHILQNNKWFLLGLDKKINFNFQSINFSDYTEFSNQQFLKMERKTSYFWDGAFQIVFFSFPTMLIAFFVFNKIFYLTFEYRISRHFRPYSFLLMIYFLGIGEDISYLSFLSFSNGMNLFSFKFQDKLGNIFWIFVFFLLVFFCSGAFFIAKILYKKLSKHFIDQCFPKFCLSMKEFVIGSVNALFAANYETLIISLAIIQVVLLIGVIYLQWKNRCYKIQTFMLILILKSIVMTVFNISLWIDWKIRLSQQAQTEQQTKELLDFNCKALVIVIIGLGVLQAISTYFSGRRILKHRPINQLSEKKQNRRQSLKIIQINYNASFKDEIPVKQQIRAQKIHLYQTKAIKIAKKKQRSKNKIKYTLKKNQNGLDIIFEQSAQNEQNIKAIFVDWHRT